jgi:dTDP-4-amino-4,6-dideoxygalactose transaminase
MTPARTEVPLMRLDHTDPAMMAELLEAVERVARAGAFILGPEVELFEAEFAVYCGVKHTVAVSSGTEALTLSLKAMEIGPGDEVIVPANSFIATAEAVTAAGATPRFADVDPDTQLVTAEQVEACLGPQVRAVIPVHLFGRPAEIAPIAELSRRHGLRLIEDAAQAQGAWDGERRVGTLADCACFSFYPSKNLGAWGDAGAITTSDAALADRVRLLRSHGERPRYHHHVPGATARMDSIQAAVLRVKLRRLDQDNQARRELARELDRALAAAAGESLRPPPAPAPGRDHVYHQYVVRCAERDRLREHLAARGVSTAIHYPVPIHRTPAYRRPGGPELPVCERLANTICSLPMFPSMTAAELGRVVDACATFTSADRTAAHAA